MKIGQMASIGTDVLPKEISNALKVLQKEAPPVSFDVIAGMIESEFGQPPGLLFDHFAHLISQLAAERNKQLLDCRECGGKLFSIEFIINIF